MTLDQYLSLLRRRWLVIVAFVALGVGAAAWHVRETPKTYQALSSAFVSTAIVGDARQSLSTVQLSLQLAQSYAKVATSAATLEQIRADLNLTSTQPLNGRLEASSTYNSLLLRWRATSTDPLRAQQIANAAPAALESVLKAVTKKSVNQVSVTLIDPAPFPRAPSGPSKKKSLALGIMLGTLSGIFVGAGLESLDTSIRTVGQGQQAFGVAPLAIVPPSRRLARRGLVTAERKDPVAESYRALRTAIGALGTHHELRTLLVTSPKAGEGKTTIVANLAITMAQGGARVCVLDADLRRSSLAKRFGVDGSVGLASVLSGQSSLSEALIETHGIWILPAGPSQPNPSELLGSTAFVSILSSLREDFDAVVIDAPPLIPVTDAVVVATQVDGVLVVARQGRTSRSDAAKSRDLIHAISAPLIGFLLNRATARSLKSAQVSEDSQELLPTDVGAPAGASLRARAQVEAHPAGSGRSDPTRSQTL